MMTHRVFLRLALAAVVPFAAIGCNSDRPTGSGPKPSDIVVNPVSISIKQRETAWIVPTVVDAAGKPLSGIPVTFVSSNVAIVTVSNTGFVTSVGPAGTATISVRAAGLTKPMPVTVVGVPTSISVSPNPAAIPQEATVQLEAKLLDLDGATINGATFTYSASNGGIATVSASGLVTSVGPAGSTVVTVRSGDGHEISKAVPVTVTPVPTKLTFSPSTLTLGRNSSAQIRPVVTDVVGSEIPNLTISYASSAPEIVSISATGLLTTTAATGSATITGRLDQLTATMTVNVVEVAHPLGSIVSSSLASGYGAAITSSGDFYVTGPNGVPVRGKLPDYTALTPINAVQAGLAVVTNRAGNAVFFAGLDGVVAYDPTQNQVRWTSATGKGAPFDVVLADDEATVFLTTGNGLVIAIDAATGSVKWELTLGYTAVHLALNPARNVLYASGPLGGAMILEIDLNTRAVMSIPMSSSAPQDLVVSPDGGELSVALESGGLAFVNTSTRTATTLITPQCPGYGLVMTPDTEQLWIGCSQTGTITVVNRQQRTIAQTIGVGDVRRLAVSPDGTVILASGQSKITFIR